MAAHGIKRERQRLGRGANREGGMMNGIWRNDSGVKRGDERLSEARERK